MLEMLINKEILEAEGILPRIPDFDIGFILSINIIRSTVFMKHYY